MLRDARVASFLGAVVCSALVLGCSQPIDDYFIDYVGTEPPSLAGPGVTWLNGTEQDWPDLKGKVVLVQFSFLR